MGLSNWSLILHFCLLLLLCFHCFSNRVFFSPLVLCRQTLVVSAMLASSQTYTYSNSNAQLSGGSAASSCANLLPSAVLHVVRRIVALATFLPPCPPPPFHGGKEIKNYTHRCLTSVMAVCTRTMTFSMVGGLYKYEDTVPFDNSIKSSLRLYR